MDGANKHSTCTWTIHIVPAEIVLPAASRINLLQGCSTSSFKYISTKLFTCDDVLWIYLMVKCRHWFWQQWMISKSCWQIVLEMANGRKLVLLLAWNLWDHVRSLCKLDLLCPKEREIVPSNMSVYLFVYLGCCPILLDCMHSNSAARFYTGNGMAIFIHLQNDELCRACSTKASAAAFSSTWSLHLRFPQLASSPNCHSAVVLSVISQESGFLRQDLPQTKTDSTTYIGHDTHGKKSSRKCTRTQLVLKRPQNLKAISYRSGVQQRTSTLVSLLCSFLIPSLFSAARHVRAPLSRADILKTGSQEPVLLSNKSSDPRFPYHLLQNSDRISSRRLRPSRSQIRILICTCGKTTICQLSANNCKYDLGGRKAHERLQQHLPRRLKMRRAPKRTLEIQTQQGKYVSK